MSGFNKVVLLGNLAFEPKSKQVGEGWVTEIRLAVNTSYYSKAHETRKEDVCFVDVSFWGARGKAIKDNLSKGDPILVEGRLVYRTWDGDDGPRSKHSIVGDNFTFVGRRSDKGEGRSVNEDEVPF